MYKKFNQCLSSWIESFLTYHVIVTLINFMIKQKGLGNFIWWSYILINAGEDSFPW